MPDVLRAVVVDDEPAAREAVIGLLKTDSRLTIEAEARNGTEAVDVVRRVRPDLLFLDVQMPDRDGFQVLEVLGDDLPRGIIFVTAHDQHALRAFEVHALDYLLKPFGQPRLRAAVDRAIERLRAQDALRIQETVAAIVAAKHAGQEPAAELTLSPAPLKRIGVRTGARVVLVDVGAIDWIEARGDYVRLYAGDRVHLVSDRMRELEQSLEPAQFLRVHRSITVNLERVAELARDPDGSGAVLLKTGVRLRVARARWDALIRALGVANGKLSGPLQR